MADCQKWESPPTYSLHLTHAEAIQLKGLIQNPLSDQEDQETNELRQSIWNALDNQGVQVI